MFRGFVFTALAVLVLVLAGCNTTGRTLKSDTEKESRIEEAAEKLGIRIEAIDVEASAQSPNGLIYMRPLIRTDKVDRLQETIWSHLFRPDHQRLVDGDPLSNRELCYRQEAYDARYHDYCQCLFDSDTCPSLEDAQSCNPGEECDPGDESLRHEDS